MEMVASVMGISQPTLRKVYFTEVAAREVMALKVKSEQLARLTDAAIGGNVAAEKALAGMIQAEQLRSVGAKIKERGRAEPAPRLGKKEAAKEAAAKASGKYAKRNPPPMLLN
ncbi:hypothetical protein [Novosphingobium clariflavum]|uniref:Uncharacterized protein n=1 Tax=Novosphingobium clariflavum TaxID=2029884 RepID=A0ABV6S5Y5_9SPHN|nr:hypothetical protein [Novosphingobium clariflavum]